MGEAPGRAVLDFSLVKNCDLTRFIPKSGTFFAAREHALSKDAKKGLESKEDIDSASRSLRVTEKDNKTGIGTEKTNPYDGVRENMLFHIKGMCPPLTLSWGTSGMYVGWGDR